MPRIRRIGWISALLVAGFGLSSVCRAQIGISLVGNMEVAPLGLETMWSTMIRVDPSRSRVGSLQVASGLLLAHTTAGTVQAIDAETGRRLWTTSVGDPNYPTMAPSANDKYVGITNGSTLYLLDRSNGAIIWEQKVGGSPCAGSAMNDERVIVPLDSGIVEAYLLQRRDGKVGLADRIPKRFSGSGGAVTSPVVSGKRINWTTLQGLVYSSEDAFKLTQFRFRADDKVSAAPVYMPPFLYAASRRGTVYGLEGTAGVEMWRLSAGGSVSHPLVAIDGALYVITETGEMLRLNPRTGAQVWFARGVRQFLSAGAGRLYVLDSYGRLTVRDAAGGPLGSAATYGFDLPCINTESDRIYLASSTGLVQCLRASRQLQPLKHTPGFAVPPPPKEGEAPVADAAATGEAPAAVPAANNPFGAPPAAPANP